ncbi:MAG: hypothetical protein ACRDZ2_05935, partial [Ilumatobacteraceae bacterium]
MPSRTGHAAAVAIVSATLVAALLPAVAAVHSVPNEGSTVFINELHYDNASTDTGEAIEVAAPAGTNLTGWSIVLY